MIHPMLDELRRLESIAINSNPRTKEELEALFGPVWGPEQLSEDFEVKGFAAPYVVVRRRTDDSVGSLMFQHNPRYYFYFTEDGSW